MKSFTFTSRLYTLFLLFVTLFSFTSALPIGLERRDVWVPPITYPTANSVWVVGAVEAVTWDTSTKPVNVTNPTGLVYLRKGGVTQSGSLAEGFNLTDGSVLVTVPDVEPGDDWQIVLMGDSGNFSPVFQISAACSSA